MTPEICLVRYKFSRFLKAQLKKHGMSYSELARAINRPVEILEGYACAARELDCQEICPISRHFQVNVFRIFKKSRGDRNPLRNVYD